VGEVFINLIDGWLRLNAELLEALPHRLELRQPILLFNFESHGTCPTPR
jgi:hypothetical protein